MSLTNQLRKMIADCGLSQHELAKLTNVRQPMISRFINGRDLALSSADKLAEHFGLELQPMKAKRKK